MLRARLSPGEEDYARVFMGEAAEVAHKGYAELWAKQPPTTAQSERPVEIRCYVSPAGMLADANELSHHFPQGYRSVARWLKPQRIWVAWKYIKPGKQPGQAYNGLVWVDDHWAWFPKPFRVLRNISEKRTG